ncbi:hypothetical protein FF011L_18840 [Roseimaritima multifibrata]|uniref:Uncharacterized protein n=1 Tax=Roseimaritima multifibrata TaxID=1930274 RepID=A0A517ME20_9BACT|nr:hypothetical protein FF011L_18840 [Roseimaritima multifibrata]
MRIYYQPNDLASGIVPGIHFVEGGYAEGCAAVTRAAEIRAAEWLEEKAF